MPNIGLNGVTNMQKRIKWLEQANGFETADFCNELQRAQNAAGKWEYYVIASDTTPRCTQIDTLRDALILLRVICTYRWRLNGFTADATMCDEINKYIYGE
jgi:hypothetical protein